MLFQLSHLSLFCYWFIYLATMQVISLSGYMSPYLQPKVLILCCPPFSLILKSASYFLLGRAMASSFPSPDFLVALGFLC